MTPKPMTQHDHFWLAHRSIADANNTFLELVKSGMTRSDLKANIDRNPKTWSRFSHWLDKLPEEEP